MTGRFFLKTTQCRSAFLDGEAAIFNTAGREPWTSVHGRVANLKKGDSPHSKQSAWWAKLGLTTLLFDASSPLHFRHSALSACGVFAGGKLPVSRGGWLLVGPLADDSEFPVDDDWLRVCGFDIVTGDRAMDRGVAHSLPAVLHASSRADALCETPAGKDALGKSPTASGVGDFV